MAAAGEVRKNLASLPGQFSIRILACLRFVARVRGGSKFRDRRSEALFARELGALIDSTHRELTDEDIAPAASLAWLGAEEAGNCADVPGSSKSAVPGEACKHDRIPAAAPARRRQRKAANHSGTGG